MTDGFPRDYSLLDRPEILQFIFHPRPEYPGITESGSARDMPIPVEADVSVGSRLHVAAADAPTILFFHGNGEIVADYEDLGPVYNQMGMNFWVVDYRGYGRSGGTPTVSAMMHDAQRIFTFAEKWLKAAHYTGPLIIMGRSLGSASALDLATSFTDQIDGLIIESGFAYAKPLLELLGVNIAAIGFKEDDGFGNLDKMASFPRPTLIIHAEFDHIIPFTDAEALYQASPAADKTLIKIPGANHNDIFMRGLTQYLNAVNGLAKRVSS
jgi:fermentation-respiration switch protein FrsA (DUF1100 family)